jgi:hypothetical protein
MERAEGRRPHWGRRAWVLALIGGLVGWIVVCASGLMMLMNMPRLSGAPSASFADVVDWLGGELILAVLAALVYGGPCGAVVGLVIWSAWFVVRRRAGVPDSDSSPHP